MPDPLNRNPASEKEVSKDVNKLARLPETLSDPEFAKLQFPKQDFMNNLGKEGLPNPPEPETFDPPPENLQSPNGLNETNDFKVNFRPNANERNFEHLPTESILLKKRDMNVNLSDAAVIFNSERLYGAVSSLVNTADGFIGKELTGVVFNSKMQNLEVSSGDKRYLISSRYEFEEIQSSPLEKVYRTELEKLEEESKELISTLDGMTTIEEYHERSQNWLTKVEEHSDRIDFSPFFGLNGSVRNYDQLSAEDKLIVKSLIEDKEKLNEVFEKFNLFKKKEREIKGLREKLESSKYYEGTLSDGTEVLASYDTESKKIDIFDLSNNRIAKEYVSYGSLIYQRNLPNNFIELRTTPSLNDEQGMTREIQDSDLRSQIVERYDVNGELSETSYVNLGYLDKYRDGAIVDRIVSNAQVVMQNFDKVMEVEG